MPNSSTARANCAEADICMNRATSHPYFSNNRFAFAGRNTNHPTPALRAEQKGRPMPRFTLKAVEVAPVSNVVTLFQRFK